MTSSAELFGSHVLDIGTMKKRLPKATFNALRDSIEKGSTLELTHADAIAQAMMEWAQSKGATHYTHWFQPLTGLTAQKHDAFLSFDSDLNPIDRFSGSQLIQSEPDASSFPSGGMRSTFEARGYTAWDPLSPVFIMTDQDVRFLCIPSVFFSYHGHVLDKKTPLLRSLKALNSAASRAIELLTGVSQRVTATVGFEQEYFLVDSGFFDKRPDLVMAGRTILGARPAKGQQMEDHYFGSIRTRVLNFMEDVENHLYKLGVPCKTRHNEVAPNQYEMAPIFHNANLAADHNQLAMEVLKKVAKQHGLAALLHEKPFAGVNGSGKHINWSMQSADGTNLLDPGAKPHANLPFLYFLVAVIHAVHTHGSLLRATIATPGNDHRLGANEAPPAIMSVFLGSHLSDILEKIESSSDFSAATDASIDLGLIELPSILVDTTDRNRTSPFAFTGNKFEFRACGSGQSISLPTAVLNAAVAESLNAMNADLEKVEQVNEKAVFQILKPYIKKSLAILFEGNNYSEEWRLEAESRGLTNFRTTPEAFEVWRTPKTRQFISQIGLFSEHEIEARYIVQMEHYAKTIDIEATLMLRMIDHNILPAGFRYQSEISQSVQQLHAAARETGTVDIGAARTHQGAYLAKLSTVIGNLLEGRGRLAELIEKAHLETDLKQHALFYAQQVVPLMEEVRVHADALETLVDAKLWTLPTYYELMFIL